MSADGLESDNSDLEECSSDTDQGNIVFSLKTSNLLSVEVEAELDSSNHDQCLWVCMHRCAFIFIMNFIHMILVLCVLEKLKCYSVGASRLNLGRERTKFFFYYAG